MFVITNRAEAKEASLLKWEDVLTRIGGIQNDIDTMCGFCLLAKEKANKVKKWRCNLCEPDAKKLCEEYVTGSRMLYDSLEDAYKKTHMLLTQIRSLPVDLK